MARSHGIISYGTEDDRLKLAAIASVEKKSGSVWVIEQIRKRYVELYGDLDPKLGTRS